MKNRRTCQNCGHTWAYPAALKRAWLSNSTQKCAKCGADQYLSAHSRMRSGTYAVMVMVAILLIRVLVDLSMAQSVTLAISLFLAVFLIYPFTIELTNANQRFSEMKRKK
ncbi:TIGR04104 family putative zinc finger protein [Chryseomicrobium sp. FSL W7-1435]|uniref:TIGR04104 family putative zinc finger protein n=1 Tax=Chryseomicrobium sp. FSL W7-1435 TaxID=2921704 RepID=UPI003159C8C7